MHSCVLETATQCPQLLQLMAGDFGSGIFSSHFGKIYWIYLVHVFPLVDYYRMIFPLLNVKSSELELTKFPVAKR